MCKEHYEANEERLQLEIYINEANELEVVSDDIVRGVYDMNFNNIHLVAKYMYQKLDYDTITALILELEANIQFGDKNGI